MFKSFASGSVKLSALLLAVMVSGSFQAASAFDAASFSVKFGAGAGKLMCYNSKVKSYEEPYPAGPSAFCIVGGKTAAVLDTFNRSLKLFDENGKLGANLNIGELAKKEIPADSPMGLSCVSARTDEKGVSEFAVSDRANGKIYILSAGRLVKTFGTPGREKFQLGQIEEIAFDSDGSIAVCDWTNNKICVFDKDLKPVREVPSQLNGMYYASGILYYIEKGDAGKLAFMKLDVKTDKPEKLFELDRPASRIVKLLAVDSKGNARVAFFDDSIQENLMKDGAKDAPMGFYTVAVISPAGKVASAVNLPVTTAFGSQFFFDRGAEKLYYQDYNADLAPEGVYTIKPIK